MIDWKRMERQYWYNKAAVFLLALLIFLDVDEVVWAFRYHFPWWDDLMMFISVPLTYACWFVKRYTDMYRIDL